MSDADLDVLHRRIFEIVNRKGERSVAITELDGGTALRLVAVSPAVTGRALIETVEELRGVGRGM
jgi:hypothetical protein